MHVFKARLKVPRFTFLTVLFSNFRTLHSAAFSNVHHGTFRAIHFFVKAVIQINTNFLQLGLGRKMNYVSVSKFSSEAWILSVLPASLFVIVSFSFASVTKAFGSRKGVYLYSSINAM